MLFVVFIVDYVNRSLSTLVRILSHVHEIMNLGSTDRSLFPPSLSRPIHPSRYSRALVRFKSHLQEKAGRQKIKAMREGWGIPERVANVITFQFEDGNCRRARQTVPRTQRVDHPSRLPRVSNVQTYSLITNTLSY